ncbi:helix-turn-helix domain-containing protein [Actinomycetes bacterium KLBMP 9759]
MPGPLEETLHSLKSLRREPESVVLSPWRQHVHAILHPGLRTLPAASGTHSGLVLARIAEVGVATPRREFAVAANAVLTADRIRTPTTDRNAAPAARHRKELRELAVACDIPLHLVHQICAYHRAAVAPVWSTVRAHHSSDRAIRTRTMLEHGVEGLLSTLHPRLRWNAPTLTLLDSPDGEIHLDGRGLVLAPSFFMRKPTFFVEPTPAAGPAVLIYPVHLDPTEMPDIWRAADAERAIGRLIGRTRALVLRAIASGTGTTGGVARRIGISAAAVSQHLNVLRDARLIVTGRHDAGARHSVTARGLDLLEQWEDGT